MGWQELKAKHGSTGRQCLNRAIRAEIPGGAMLIDACYALTTEALRPRHDRPVEQVMAIRVAAGTVNATLDALRKSIMETYGIGEVSEDPPTAQKETLPQKRALSVIEPQGANHNLVSIPAPSGASPPGSGSV